MIILKHCSLSEIDDIIEARNIEIIDVEEDVLLDNMIGTDPAGDLVLFKVCYVNSNMSDYTVKKAEDPGEASDIWEEWEHITMFREEEATV